MLAATEPETIFTKTKIRSEHTGMYLFESVDDFKNFAKTFNSVNGARF